jgi:hypothetical protein
MLVRFSKGRVCEELLQSRGSDARNACEIVVKSRIKKLAKDGVNVLDKIEDRHAVAHRAEQGIAVRGEQHIALSVDATA